MRSVWLIGQNTYREIIRDRILYGLVVFALLLLALSLALAQLSFTEQARINLNFGLTGIHLSCLILSIFVGSTLVSKELDKRTVYTIVTHGVSRSQFLVGKFFGMLLVTLVVTLSLSLILLGIMQIIEVHKTPLIIIALYGIILESMVLMATTILFGVFCSSLLTVIFTIGVALIGHWMNDLGFFAAKSESLGMSFLYKIVSYGLPNLERFNWKSHVTYSDAITSNMVLSTSVYGFAWVIILLSLASIIFNRRDFT